MKESSLCIVCGCHDSQAGQCISSAVILYCRLHGTAHSVDNTSQCRVTAKKGIFDLCLPFFYFIIWHSLFFLAGQRLIAFRRVSIIQRIHLFHDGIILFQETLNRVIDCICICCYWESNRLIFLGNTGETDFQSVGRYDRRRGRKFCTIQDDLTVRSLDQSHTCRNGCIGTVIGSAIYCHLAVCIYGYICQTKTSQGRTAQRLITVCNRCILLCIGSHSRFFTVFIYTIHTGKRFHAGWIILAYSLLAEICHICFCFARKSSFFNLQFHIILLQLGTDVRHRIRVRLFGNCFIIVFLCLACLQISIIIQVCILQTFSCFLFVLTVLLAVKFRLYIGLCCCISRRFLCIIWKFGNGIQCLIVVICAYTGSLQSLHGLIKTGFVGVGHIAVPCRFAKRTSCRHLRIAKSGSRNGKSIGNATVFTTDENSLLRIIKAGIQAGILQCRSKIFQRSVCCYSKLGSCSTCSNTDLLVQQRRIQIY